MRILLAGTSRRLWCLHCGGEWWEETDEHHRLGCRYEKLIPNSMYHRMRRHVRIDGENRVRVDVIELGDGRGSFENSGYVTGRLPVVVTAANGTLDYNIPF